MRYQFHGSLAQLVEHRTFNPMVEGSNPSRPTIEINKLAVIYCIYKCGLREFLRELTANFLRWLNFVCIKFKLLRASIGLEPRISGQKSGGRDIVYSDSFSGG